MSLPFIFFYIKAFSALCGNSVRFFDFMSFGVQNYMGYLREALTKTVYELIFVANLFSTDTNPFLLFTKISIEAHGLKIKVHLKPFPTSSHI